MIRCHRKALSLAVSAAAEITPASTTKPILINLLIDAKPGALDVVAYDGTNGVRCLVTTIESTAHQFIVPAKPLARILRESSSRFVTLTPAPGDQLMVTIDLDDGQFALPVIELRNAESFPKVDHFPELESYGINGDRFADMLAKAIPAMDRDRTSMVLSGVLSGLYLAIDKWLMILTATDGKYLVESTDSHNGDRAATASAILRPDLVAHLRRLLPVIRPHEIRVAIAGKTIHLRLMTPTGTIDLLGRAIEGQFPPYQNAMPAAAPINCIDVDRRDLITAIKRLRVLTPPYSRGMLLTYRQDLITITTLSHTIGTASIPVPCIYTGPKGRIAFNADYLLTVLQRFVPERLSLEFHRGLLIREHGARHLIMPISLPDAA